MRRAYCGKMAGLLAGVGLALGSASAGFAQAPPTMWTPANANANATAATASVPAPALATLPAPAPASVPEGAYPRTPADFSPPPPDAGAETMSLDAGEFIPDRWYGGAEYLLWRFKDSPLPVPMLTTTSNPNNTPVAVIGDPNTSVLLGEQNLGSGAHSGGRFNLGYWIDDRRQIAVEGGYFFLAGTSTTRYFASDGGPTSAVLAVPFFDEDAGAESSFALASPGASAGSATLTLSTRLQGAELHGVVQAIASDDMHVDVLIGGRFLQLTENLTFTTTSTGLSDPNTDLVLNTADQFDTRNNFYAWQVGARGGWAWEGFELEATAKLALGEMHETINLNGAAVTNFFNGQPGGPFTGVPTQVVPGNGTFVQPSNLGRFSRDVIAVAPEVDVTLGYRLTDHVRVFTGYDFLYISNVLRPGEQIDRGINFSQTVQSVIAGNAAATGTRPMAAPVGSDFWAQGLHVGLELRY